MEPVIGQPARIFELDSPRQRRRYQMWAWITLVSTLLQSFFFLMAFQSLNDNDPPNAFDARLGLSISSISAAICLMALFFWLWPRRAEGAPLVVGALVGLLLGTYFCATIEDSFGFFGLLSWLNLEAWILAIIGAIAIPCVIAARNNRRRARAILAGTLIVHWAAYAILVGYVHIRFRRLEEIAANTPFPGFTLIIVAALFALLWFRANRN